MEENKLQFEDSFIAHQDESSLLTPTKKQNARRKSSHYHNDEGGHADHAHQSEEEEDAEKIEKLVRLRDKESIVFNYYRMSKMLGAGKYTIKDLCARRQMTCS